MENRSLKFTLYDFITRPDLIKEADLKDEAELALRPLAEKLAIFDGDMGLDAKEIYFDREKIVSAGRDVVHFYKSYYKSFGP